MSTLAAMWDTLRYPHKSFQKYLEGSFAFPSCISLLPMIYLSSVAMSYCIAGLHLPQILASSVSYRDWVGWGGDVEW